MLQYVGHETATVDTDTRRKFATPKARAHEQEYNQHLILVVYIHGSENSKLFILTIAMLCVTIMGSISNSLITYLYKYFWCKLYICIFGQSHIYASYIAQNLKENF